MSSVKGEHVLDKNASMDSIPNWFKDARLNFAENLLWCRSKDKTAIIATGKETKRGKSDSEKIQRLTRCLFVLGDDDRRGPRL